MNSASDSNEEFSSTIVEQHPENYLNNVQFTENGEFLLGGPMLDDRKSCTCKDCGKVFNSVWYLKQHAVKHSSERPFKCKYCHKTYRFRSNLYQHKCPSRDRACELNGSRKSSNQKSPSKRKTTSLLNDGGGTFLLDDASSTTSSRKTTPKKSSNNSFTSSNGGATSTTNNVAIAVNNVVDASSSFQNKLQNWDVNSDGSSYVSPTGSPQKFSPSPTNEEIQQFLDRHKDQLHKCPQCKILFPSREYLTRHMSWHNVEEAKVKCTFCSELFDNDQQYGLHKQSHVPHSVHICVKCKGKFCHRLALKKHLAKCRSGRFWPTTPTPQNGAYNPALFIDRTPPSTPAESESSPPTEENDAGSVDSGGSVGEHHQINDFVNHQQEPSSMITVGVNGVHSDTNMIVSMAPIVDNFDHQNFIETCNNSSSLMHYNNEFTSASVLSSTDASENEHSSHFNFTQYGASSSIPFHSTSSSSVMSSTTASTAVDYYSLYNNNAAPMSSLPLTNSYSSSSSSSSSMLRDEKALSFIQPSLIPPYNYHFGVADVNTSGPYRQFSAQTSQNNFTSSSPSFYIPYESYGSSASNVVAGRSWTPDSDSNDHWLLPQQTGCFAQPNAYLDSNTSVSSSLATLASSVNYLRPNLIDNTKRLHGFDAIYPGNAEICGPMRADTPSIAALVEQRGVASTALVPSAIDDLTSVSANHNVATYIASELLENNVDFINFPTEQLASADELMEESATETLRLAKITEVEEEKLKVVCVEQQLFQCDACERLFCTSKGLHGHFLKIHIFNGAQRTYKKDFAELNGVSSKNNKYSCMVCLRQFDTDVQLTAHNLSEHRSESDGIRFACDLCPKSFRRKEHLQKHQKLHSVGQQRLQFTGESLTDGGEKTSVNEDNLAAASISTSPLRRSARQKYLKTTDSLKVFQTKPNYSNAECLIIPNYRPPVLVLTPKNDKTMKVSTSATTSKSSSFLRSRLGNKKRSSSMRSVDDETHRCSYCPKTFRYKRYVKKHERLQHELPIERRGESSSLVHNLKNKETFKIQCPFCVKRFASPRLLKQHLAFHARANKLGD